MDPARLPQREPWVAAYEQGAAGFAACRFQASMGSGAVHPEIRDVIELHDRASRATGAPRPGHEAQVSRPAT